jgi:5'-nucleotidase/UDP-sugar diphosphatase
MLKRVLPLLLLSAGLALSADEVRTVTILHTNDLHARLSPLDSGQGGFAYVAAVIRREREHCTGCLLLNAGDVVQGSPVSTIFRGLPVFEITNMFGYDAGTLGNHDFDYGWQQARKFMETATYPIADTNIVDRDGHLFTAQPYVVLQANGVKLAVVGAMTDTLDTLTTPNLLGPWHTTSLLDAVRRYAAEARGRADLVLVLAHVTENEEHELANIEPGVPVIITGHAHNGIPVPITGTGGFVVRAKAYGEEVGRLELDVDVPHKSLVSWHWKQIPVDSKTVAAAPDVAAQVKHWEDQVSRIVDKPIGQAEREFTRAEVKLLIERAMREETRADFAFMNAGGVRDILPRGQILLRHVWNIMPFDNQVVVGHFKGSQLPAVVTRGHTIEPDRDYTLAVSDFTAANQGAASQLETTGLEFPSSGPLLRDVITDWIKHQAVLK